MAKKWINRALELLDNSLSPVPQELNELDWKESLSPSNKKLAQHLSAFANHPGGGYLVFGIQDDSGKIVGVTKADASAIIEKLSNLGRDSISPLISLDHAVEGFRGVPILLVYVKEASVKPAHIASGTIEDSFIRSGGRHS